MSLKFRSSFSRIYKYTHLMILFLNLGCCYEQFVTLRLISLHCFLVFLSVHTFTQAPLKQKNIFVGWMAKSIGTSYSYELRMLDQFCIRIPWRTFKNIFESHLRFLELESLRLRNLCLQNDLQVCLMHRQIKQTRAVDLQLCSEDKILKKYL